MNTDILYFWYLAGAVEYQDYKYMLYPGMGDGFLYGYGNGYTYGYSGNSTHPYYYDY
jgi:hypothetical protein